MFPPKSTNSLIPKRFNSLSVFLKTHRVLWQARPFVERVLTWEDEYTNLSKWLRNLSHAEIDQCEANLVDGILFDAPFPLNEWQKTAQRHNDLPQFGSHPCPSLGNRRYAHGIPERKWRQINQFIETCAHLLPQRECSIIDWCAGKGHVSLSLNRALNARMTALEKREDLCEHGRALAIERKQKHCSFHSVDVIHQKTDRYWNHQDAGVALHACGFLTDELFDMASLHQTPYVVAVPCCYHNLGGKDFYEPQSEAGCEQCLPLSQAHLRLATAEEAVAREPIRKARRREMSYRLGLDLLFREATGKDVYQLQGPFSKELLNANFETFCRLASQKLELPLPRDFSPETALLAGEERAREVRALGLVRATFRRSLELWLILDRAMKLIESEREVQVGTFCSRRITPRNIMLFGKLVD